MPGRERMVRRGLHETAARHRTDPFRRHRRHRHERHCRGAGQSRLHGDRAPTWPRAPMSSGCATRASRSRSAMAPPMWRVPTCWWSPRRSSATIPELVAARAKRLPVVRRAEMLAELMRLKSCVAIAGTHGKTTTTSLVATLLDAGAPRSDRHQWRHHQRLRHQCAPRRRRLDGGGGRRIRRHLPQTAGRYRDRHQCRPRAPRPFQDLRCRPGGVPDLRRERAVLWLRGDVHRPSGGAHAWSAASRIAASSPMGKTRRPTCALSASPCRRRLAILGHLPRPRRRATCTRSTT